MKSTLARTTVAAAVASASMLMAGQAAAVMVGDFTVDIGGGWVVNDVTPTCDAGGVGIGSCVDADTAGANPGTFLNIEWEDGGDPQSSLSIDWDVANGAGLDPTGSYTVTENAGQTQVSRITHNNIVINPFEDHVDRLQLEQNFAVSTTGGVISAPGGVLDLGTITFDVQFIESRNAGIGGGVCEAGGSPLCQDLFLLRNFDAVVPAGPIPFEVCANDDPTDCWDYALSIEIEGLVQTTGAGLLAEFPNLMFDAGEEIPAGQNVGYFVTSENNENFVDTFVSISAVHDPVEAPEPSGLAIVGLGLLAAGAARFPKRRAS